RINRGVGYVIFAERGDAEKAVEHMNGGQIDSIIISCTLVKDEPRQSEVTKDRIDRDWRERGDREWRDRDRPVRDNRDSDRPRFSRPQERDIRRGLAYDAYRPEPQRSRSPRPQSCTIRVRDQDLAHQEAHIRVEVIPALDHAHVLVAIPQARQRHREAQDLQVQLKRELESINQKRKMETKATTIQNQGILTQKIDKIKITGSIFDEVSKSIMQRVLVQNNLFGPYLRIYQFSRCLHVGSIIREEPKANLENSEPSHNSTVEEKHGQKWSVLPRFRNPATNRLWTKRFMDDSPLSSSTTPAERILVPKRMEDSYVEEFLPFKSYPAELENYINFYGGVRIGKIFEDLDAMAGSASYKHADDGLVNTPPLTIVTASVDRIDLLSRIPADKDLRLSGYVTYVGSSSMEVSLALHVFKKKILEVSDGYIVDPMCTEKNEIESQPILVAKFTMVARDPLTGKAARVNPLRLDTDEERELFRLGAGELKARKQFQFQTSLAKAPPTIEEMFLIHQLHLESKPFVTESVPKPDDVVSLFNGLGVRDTVYAPGGFLMRLAYELAYATAISFAKVRPSFIALDDIVFRSPVNIGSILSCKAKVVYSAETPIDMFPSLKNSQEEHLDDPSAWQSSHTFQVTVDAFVEDPLTGNTKNTNTFHFTFAVPATGIHPNVIPQTYEEREEKEREIFRNEPIQPTSAEEIKTFKFLTKINIMHAITSVPQKKNLMDSENEEPVVRVKLNNFVPTNGAEVIQGLTPTQLAAASEAQLRLQCRMYENKYPEVDDLVMVVVTQLAELGAYVHLLEYNNIEGMILHSELSRRRIRSIQKLVRVGRNEVVVVIKIDKEKGREISQYKFFLTQMKGYIDLSKRRVSPEDIMKCEEKFRKSTLVHGIMRHVAQKLGLDLEELYNDVGWPLYKTYGHAYEAFKLAI
ncbi:hypothetical protein HK096_000996, partial [Nowakowskiella sp. JEL0078]